jgi:hypothetical protein
MIACQCKGGPGETCDAGNLVASQVLLQQNIVPLPASPSMLQQTQSQVGDNIFNVLGNGIAIATQQDLGLLSHASGLASYTETRNLVSHVALYTPIDDPYWHQWGLH